MEFKVEGISSPILTRKPLHVIMLAIDEQRLLFPDTVAVCALMRLAVEVAVEEGQKAAAPAALSCAWARGKDSS